MDKGEKTERHREWLRDKSQNGGEPFDGRYTVGDDKLLQRLRLLKRLGSSRRLTVEETPDEG